ncbi:MAG: lipopolysaccharide export system ATP-binding protein [Alphaproteobacteria bacterium]
MSKITSLNTAKTGLRVEGLKKVIGKRVILNDVSFNLQRGEVLALLGPNGAGKTTSFHAVVGLLETDEGTITIDGVSIEQWPVYRRARYGLGYLPQESSIFRGMNVEDNIKSVLEIVEKNPPSVRSRLKELLHDFGLNKIKKSLAPALSGGERRRVEIARALASRPVYVLLDEPFAGVDPLAIHDVRKLVLDLKNRGIGVLITDHNVRETLSIVDRACILHDGRIIMEGTPEEIVANEEVKKVYLGADFKMS